MKKPLLRLTLAFLILIALSYPGYSQLKNSADLINNGIDLFEKQEYKKANEFFSQVPEGDTNYSIALYEAALAYASDSAFNQAKELAQKGLYFSKGANRKFWLLLGTVNDYQGNKDSALYYYDKLIAENPNDHQPVYEKGIIAFREKEYDKAAGLFQQAIMINPHHFRSQLMLGNVFAIQGRLTESYVVLLFSLLSTNNIDIARKSILLLDEIAKQHDEVVKFYQEKDSKYNQEQFDETDQLINSKLATSKDYKINSDLEDNMIKVAYMIMEKINYDKSDNNFVMQYYIPLLKQVQQKEMFDPLIYLLFSGYNIEAIERKVQKQKGNMQAIKELVFPYLDTLISTRMLNYEDRKKAPFKYYTQSADGIYVSANLATIKPLVMKEGAARFFTNGELSGEGQYNSAGKKQGLWKYYYDNGILRLEENYNNGTITGTSKTYYDNGILKEEEEVNSKSESILLKEYAYNGALENEIKLIGDKTFEKTLYYADGRKQSVLRIKDGKTMDGNYKVYAENGALYRTIPVVNDKIEGDATWYYENGETKVITPYKNGKKNGLYKSFYEGGKLHEQIEYSDDEEDGNYEEWEKDGKDAYKVTYSNGKKDGDEILYDDGREYGRITYRKGVPVAYRFTDPDGKVVGKSEDRDMGLLRIFSSAGIILRTNQIKEGKLSGEEKNYFESGEVKSVSHYIDNVQTGHFISYYKNGQESFDCDFVDGKMEGAYKGYHENGKLLNKGWLIAGNKEGPWQFYHANGTLETDEFCVNGEVNGPVKSYDVSGGLEYIDYYDHGILIGMAQYDTTGNLISRQSYPKGMGRYELKYPYGNSKQNMFESAVKYGNYDGPYTKYAPDGTLLEKGFFHNGKKDSTYTAYNNLGIKIVTGSFRAGEKNGLWRYYDDNGALTREMNFKNDKEVGRDDIYNNGELSYSYNDNERGVLDGDQYVYGEGKKIAAILKYKDGLLTGYTYEDKDGHLVPVIPVKNGQGSVTTFYANGQKAVTFNYLHNSKDGTQSRYYSNGQLAEQKELGKGMYQGRHVIYYPDGKLLLEESYVDDELLGEKKTYDKTGKMISLYTYYYDYLHGPVILNTATANKTINYRYGRITSIKK